MYVSYMNTGDEHVYTVGVDGSLVQACVTELMQAEIGRILGDLDVDDRIERKKKDPNWRARKEGRRVPHWMR